jgi:hypothetical protein
MLKWKVGIFFASDTCFNLQMLYYTNVSSMLWETVDMRLM